MHYKYKVTVIVPVYNVEQYLDQCLESLINQTIDKSDMEVLLINDGSTDNSLEICEEYAELFPFIKLIDKENEGVSATRNLGIRKATGKYLFFLDSDDTISNNTFQEVTDFFDKHYDEVDVVAFYDQYYRNGVKEVPHMRYKFLTKTGVYDLNQQPYALQLRLSMCTKNRFEENILFNESMSYQEDQAYCSELLKDKFRLGFVKEAIYNYNKNDSGIVINETNPIVMFEKTTSYFEEFFSDVDKVPPYYQAMFFHDIQWKLSSACLYPYHYSDEELEKAKKRIVNMLRKVDNSVIMQHPSLDNYQKLYWIRQKRDGQLCPNLNDTNMIMTYNGKKLYDRNNVEIILKSIILKNQGIRLTAYFKSPFFSLIDDVHFYVYENSEKRELAVKVATNSYYKAKEKTETFYSFIYRCAVKKPVDIRFSVVLDGIEYPTKYWIPSDIAFSKASGFSVIADQGVRVEYKDDIFYCYPASAEECNRMVASNTKSNAMLEIRSIREFYIQNNKRRIWLYTDNYSVEFDNGWQQFIHDVEKKDGIERYYIVTNHFNDSIYQQNAYADHLLEFGSLKHRIIFPCAEYLFTAFVEEEVCFPYSDAEKSALCDILNVDVIYLQHGVFHAHLPWYYSPTSVKVSKEVISSNFERENLSQNYGFDLIDLIPSGMPRYDFIDRTKPAKNQILFAPSWRSYLTGDMVSGNKVRKGNNARLVSSNYYKNLEAFIRNEKLQSILREHDMVLYLKLHPEFYSTYSNISWIQTENVKLAENKVDLTEFAVFITDFSSYVFDYAILKRPIMYFVPDYTEFKAGLNRYRELDIPYEKAFGPLAITPKDAVVQLENILIAHCEAEPIYRERMSNFYLNLDNCRENLYNHMMQEG